MIALSIYDQSIPSISEKSFTNLKTFKNSSLYNTQRDPRNTSRILGRNFRLDMQWTPVEHATGWTRTMYILLSAEIRERRDPMRARARTVKVMPQVAVTNLGHAIDCSRRYWSFHTRVDILSFAEEPHKLCNMYLV